MNEKIKAKMEDKEFAKKVLGCKDKQEITLLFAKNGVELTCEELRNLGAVINSAAAETKELSEDDLEHVPGGVGTVGMPEGSEGIVALIGSIADKGLASKLPAWWNPQDPGHIVCAYGIKPPLLPVDWPEQPQKVKKSENLE